MYKSKTVSNLAGPQTLLHNSFLAPIALPYPSRAPFLPKLHLFHITLQHLPTLPAVPIQLTNILHTGKRARLTDHPVSAVGVERPGSAEIGFDHEVGVAAGGEGDGEVAHFGVVCEG